MSISILDFNELAASTVSASSGVVVSLPETNALSEQPSTIVRWTGAGPHWIEFDLGSAISIQQMYMGYHNAGASDTYSWTADTTPAPSTVRDSGDLIPGSPVGYTRHSQLAHLSSPISFRYHRITFTVTPDPFDLGIVFGGSIIEVPAQFGIQTAVVDPSPRTRAISGTAYIDMRGRYREASFTSGNLTEAEQADLNRVDIRSGASLPIVVCDRPESDTHKMKGLLHCYMTGVESFTTERGFTDAGGRRYRRRFALEESELP